MLTTHNVPYALQHINDIFPDGVFRILMICRLPHFTDNAEGLKKQTGFFSRKPLAVADLRKILAR